MAQIGTFTRGEDGSFTGQIRTLNISTKPTIRPIAKEGERSPASKPGIKQISLDRTLLLQSSSCTRLV